MKTEQINELAFREILFRGKRVDNGEWVYSSFIMQDKEHKLLSAEVELFDGENWRAVIPETFGEYTGLTDKNGKKIFEGDVVRYDIARGILHKGDKEFKSLDSYVEAVVFKEGKFVPTPHFCYCDDYWYSNEYRNFEVIGTIYDNPELLEVKE